VADIINILFNVGVKDIHLIGFSLGAHVAGGVSKYIEPNKIHRITGLDPAGMGFEFSRSSMRLDRSNAKFVDVIHTACGILGVTSPIGHIDFYPNNCHFPDANCTKIFDLNGSFNIDLHFLKNFILKK